MNLIDTAILWPRKVVEATTPYNLLSIDWAHSVLKWFDRSGRQICYLCDWSVDREHDGLYLAFHRFFPVSFRGRFDWVEKTSLAIHTSNPYNCALWNTGNDWRNRSKKKNSKVGPVWGPSLKVVLFLSEDTRFGPILDPIEVHFGPAFFFWLFLKMTSNDAKNSKNTFSSIIFVYKQVPSYLFFHTHSTRITWWVNSIRW